MTLEFPTAPFNIPLIFLPFALMLVSCSSEKKQQILDHQLELVVSTWITMLS